MVDSNQIIVTVILDLLIAIKNNFLTEDIVKKQIRKTKMMEKQNVDRNSKNAGFTFVETLAVLAIGAIITAGVGISAFKAIETARECSAKETIAQYKSALQSYYIDCGTFPSTEQGLAALWEKPVLVPVPASWQGPYLDKEVKPDPWGTNYVYVKKGSSSFPGDCPANLPYAIICYGADGVKGGEGRNADIVSWR